MKFQTFYVTHYQFEYPMKMEFGYNFMQYINDDNIELLKDQTEYSLDLLTKNVKDDSCRDIMMIGQNRCFRLTNKDIRRSDKITRRVKFEVDFS